jgi:hypothetical protein
MSVPYVFDMKKLTVLSSGIGAILLVSLLAANPAQANNTTLKGGQCSKAAKAAFAACRYEKKDDYWIAAGNCANVADADARVACWEDAAAARKEGLAECGDQRAARLEVCDAIGEARYDPLIDPAMFVDPAQIGGAVAANPYYPLVPGQQRVYQSGAETITVTVTGDTRQILGVKCVVVHDVAEEDGAVSEDTLDWYAQDIHGNVWYFGESSQSFEDGVLVSIDGSWTAGVERAKPGIVMKAAPVVGETYRQEFSLGDAEDMAQVLRLNGTAVVPAAECRNNCVVTRDFSPLEPDFNENKYYKAGIGVILEVNVETGERTQLVNMTNP